MWARTLAPAGNTRGPLEAWLRGEFKKNTPLDQIARAVLTATGDATTASPAGFYTAVGNTPERVAEAVGRGLLGVRLGCAQCHNHPYDAVSQRIVGATVEPNQQSTRVALDLVAGGRIDVAPLITHRFPFADVLSAYELHRTRGDRCVKIVVEMPE